MTPRMEPAEHARRRDTLMAHVGDNGIAVIAAAPERPRNRDVQHPYRQDSDFLYLTGFNEPDAVAVLVPGRPQGQYLLFSRERDPQRETWEGRTIGQAAAVEHYGADDAFPIDDIDDILPGLMEGREQLYCAMGADPDFDQRLIGWVNALRARARAGVKAPLEYVSLEHVVHEIRLIKSRAEIARLREAARISAAAHQRLLGVLRPGLKEYEIEAELLYDFRRHNGEPAYPTITGSGANACVLHYIANDAELQDGEMILIDAGMELGGYAADITRTLPINGRYTAEQRAIYDIVLAAQAAALEHVRPGAHWNAGHEAATRVIAAGLLDLGLLEGDLDDVIERGAYRPFFMHRTGHWLGMDVHDVGDYKVDGHWRELEPGMVLTVEPGLYIPPGSPVDARWQGIGVRIEDNCVITRTGHENLTEAVPKDPDVIEAAMAVP
ncbi:Xaa-Pro aminopeptidase [Spiribacter salinus]|uniref:Xaa-Pro aminopeptidase n=1 Tax=Spiribacter salinus TaxID=1335746 RepID=UPI001C97D841|nr:Xaa-Pro aminopeptidase [Spiribacter salinus]MBY5268725.1 Xaa-Pro aminopeptidase [Spiribacter salinus]